MTAIARNLFTAPDGIVDLAAFSAAVAAARPLIAHRPAVVNLHADRFVFTVILVAALLNGQTVVLPPSVAPEALREISTRYDAPLVVEEDDRLLGTADSADGPILTPQHLVAHALGEVHVFTSGSTATPVRHVKTWAMLAGGAEVTVELARRIAPGAERIVLIGTTPHRHMYGLEATVATPLSFLAEAWRPAVFYAADLEAALSTLAADPRAAAVLVTTPAHLKHLDLSIRRASALRGIISATAPLASEAAARVEQHGKLRVFEIYGCTEAGSMAIRRTAREEDWTPSAGFTFSVMGDIAFATAPHLPATTQIPDRLSLRPNGALRLEGRSDEQISVAGKRTTIGAVNAILAAAALPCDAVAARGLDGQDALVVFAAAYEDAKLADEALESAIRSRLLAYLDPVLVPRRIFVVDRIDRDGTGKVSAATLEALRAEGMRRGGRSPRDRA
ncbi:MAG: AMP-binding protein [Pseudomonadota bacterium]